MKGASRSKILIDRCLWNCWQDRVLCLTLCYAEQIARQYLGRDNDITRTLIKSCQAAQEHLDAARMKKGFSPPGIIRQGESMGGAYDALQQHQTVKRRAQSAGAQRSESATPRCFPKLP
jgi:hypothetical protein